MVFKYNRRTLKQERAPYVERLHTTKQVPKSRFFRKSPQVKNKTRINTIINHAMYLLKYAYELTSSKQNEVGLNNQSKALELAQKYLDADIRDIHYIQDYLGRVKTTLQEENIDSRLQYLSRDKQVEAIIRNAILAAGLPNREGLPAAGYEHSDYAQAWTNYLFALRELLPEKPYVITGTPINREDEQVRERRNRIANFFRNLFRRN